MTELLPDLFGEPRIDPSQSQFFTPVWLARKIAEWVPPTWRVLEPSAGRGNLVRALLERGHPVENIVAVDRDPRWVEFLRREFPGLEVIGGDFLQLTLPPFALVLMNPPYEGNAHMRFVLRALELAPWVFGVFPHSFLFSDERDRCLWAPVARVTHRVILPERVDFGGDEGGGKQDTIVLRITRRIRPRAPDELATETVEVWRREAP